MRESWAVITGASSGIGEEFARRLANEGYSLVLVARRRERLVTLGKMLAEQGTKSEIVTADLAQEAECRRLVDSLSDKKVGIFINNAGFGDCGCFLETDVEKEFAMIDVNVKAVHLLTKLVLRKLQAQGGGYLLNVASSAGLLPAGPYMATYYATKAYVASLTRAIAQELADSGSRVYIGALCPGPVETEFNEVANVEFVLPGIPVSYCVDCAIRGMKKREVLIVPTVTMRLATTAGRFLPQHLCIQIAGRQQKRKLGML